MPYGELLVGWLSSNYYFENQIFMSIDGGENWHEQSMPPSGKIRNIFMINENTGWAVDDQGNLLRYRGATASCAAGGGIIYMHGSSQDMNLLPEISWSPWYGCVDGYVLRISSFPGYESFLEVDVGLNTSYQLTTALPPDSGFIYKISPYNALYGEATDCDFFFLTTTTCPTLPEQIDTFICQGEAFYWDGYVFEEEGIYEIPYRDSMDCDSTITLNLQWIEPPAQTIVDTLLVSGSIFEGMTYDTDTIFTALFSSANGCDSIVTYVINIVTDVNNPDEGMIWQIYPNPAKDEVFVTGKYGWQEAVLYDLHGRKMRNWAGDNLAGQHRLDVSQLDAGMYLLRLKWKESLSVLRLILL